MLHVKVLFQKLQGYIICTLVRKSFQGGVVDQAFSYHAGCDRLRPKIHSVKYKVRITKNKRQMSSLSVALLSRPLLQRRGGDVIIVNITPPPPHL